MAARPKNAKELRAALARITDSSGRRSNHNIIFRIEVMSSDKRAVAVQIRVGQSTFFPDTSINQVADALRVGRGDVDVVWDWKLAEVTAHLSQFSADTLTSPAQERRFLNE